MTLEEKYNGWKEIFNKYFIYLGESSERASYIPLESVNFDNKTGTVGDGTINLSVYLQYAYTSLLLDEDDGTNLANGLLTLQRLIDSCYDYFVEKEPNVYFVKEPGFFLRDDIKSSDANLFNLDSIVGSYSRCIEGIEEDPCHSAFTSQDQNWWLLPILSFLKEEYPIANDIGYNIFKFVVDNKHTIYNPYYSAIYHNWTYVPDLNSNYWERIDDRNNNLKYKVKVKRGANNWYFSYGFKKAFNTFGGDSKTFWSSLWYKPFIFLADHIWEPILNLFNGTIKNTSYYSMAIGANAWYDFSNHDKRIVKRFNKALKNGEVFMPQLVFLTDRVEDIDCDLLKDWLCNYSEPTENGTIESPLTFMLLYNWYKYYTTGFSMIK